MDFLKEMAIKLVAAVLTKQFGIPPANSEKIVRALIDFGHLLVENLKPAFDSNNQVAILSLVECAVKSYQGFTGLETNGVIDPTFEKIVSTTRCGCPDIVEGENNLAMEAKWRNPNLKYFVEAYPTTRISKSDQDDIITLAFKGWSDVCGITATRTSNKNEANIVMSTGRGSAYGFDGPSGVLAWCQLPSDGISQILLRMDLDENWQVELNGAGIPMLSTLMHEIGHGINLGHSTIKSALMAPYLNRLDRPQANDDIPRCVAMYGKSITPIPNPTPNPTPSKGRLVIEFDGEIKNPKILV